MITLCVALFLAPLDLTPVEKRCIQVEATLSDILGATLDTEAEVIEDPETGSITVEFCDLS